MLTDIILLSNFHDFDGNKVLLNGVSKNGFQINGTNYQIQERKNYGDILKRVTSFEKIILFTPPIETNWEVVTVSFGKFVELSYENKMIVRFGIRYKFSKNPKWFFETNFSNFF